MGCFQVRYDSRVVIYDRKLFIRLATGCNSTWLLMHTHPIFMDWVAVVHLLLLGAPRKSVSPDCFGRFICWWAYVGLHIYKDYLVLSHLYLWRICNAIASNDTRRRCLSTTLRFLPIFVTRQNQVKTLSPYRELACQNLARIIILKKLGIPKKIF